MNPDVQSGATALGTRRRATEARKWWSAHSAAVLRTLIVLMSILAVQRLSYEFWRLLWSTEHKGAVDLKIIHHLAHAWFLGEPVYAQFRNATHPPASYAIAWPFVGWLEFTPIRWLWAIGIIPVLAWLAYLVVRESGASTRLERAFLVLMLLSSYATAVTIGNGQLILHLLPLLLTAILLLARSQGCWRVDLLVALLFLIALVKPSVTAPFFWLVLFVPGRLWPALLIVGGYIGLSLFATTYQTVGLLELTRGWLERSSATAATFGYANLHAWLASMGLERWMGVASVLALLGLGWWTYRHRDSDIWVLLGVTALVARLWTYHALYDDLLIVLPMVALLRMTRADRVTPDAEAAAAIMLAILFLAMLIPARLLSWPRPWNWPFSIGEPIAWLATLVFLLTKARRSQSSLAQE